MYRKFSIICTAFALIFIAGAAFNIIPLKEATFMRLAHAASTDALSGYAWSETIGWVSFNCTTDPGGCGSSNYGVNVDANGNFSGYAWSENIGWIQFNPAGPYPSDPQTSTKFDAITAQVSGWARACAGSPNGDCTGGMGPNANSGGWDGWIKLRNASGESPAYGVSYNAVSRQFQGWAWGSDKIGWVSFNCSDTSSCGSSSYYVGGTLNTAPTVSGLTIGSTYCGGAAQNFSWTFSDVQDGSTQTARQLQVSTAISFSSNAFDSGNVTTSSTSLFVPVSASPQANQLAFNTTYYWRIQVYDSVGTSSGWSIGSSFTTPRHAYPQPAFTLSPTSPSEGQNVSFADQTIFAPGSTSHTWQWTIPNATYLDGTSATSQNPHAKFTNTQSSTVVLQASDDVGSCSMSSIITAKPPLPHFKEVQPQ